MLILHTKDGRKRSNAIIKGGEDYSLIDGVEGPIYIVESDFGNVMKLTWKEIEQSYTVGPVRNYRDWREDRQRCIDKAEFIGEFTP